MSIVHKTLQKLNKQSKSSSVPPAMFNLTPKRRSNIPRKGLLIALAVAVFFFAITMYMESRTGKLTVASTKFEETEKPKPLIARVESNLKSVNTTQQITEADIQKRIDNAVNKALADANFDRRSALAAVLPKPAEAKVIFTQETLPDKKPLALLNTSQETENKRRFKDIAGISKRTSESNSNKKSLKPQLTEKQKAEFNKKIEYNTTLSLANRAYKSGNYSRAVEKYTEALEIKSTPSSLLNVSKAKILSGDISGVFDSFNRYSEAIDEKVISAAALEIDKAGFEKDALRLLRTYDSIPEKSSLLHYTAGQIHEKHKKFLRAETAYKKATDLNPSDIYYKYALARMLDTNGSYRKAMKLYKQTSNTSEDKSIKDYSGIRALVLEDYIKKLSE